MNLSFLKRPIIRLLPAMAAVLGLEACQVMAQEARPQGEPGRNLGAAFVHLPQLAPHDPALQWNMLGRQVIVVGDTDHTDQAQFENFVKTLLDAAQLAGVKYIAIEEDVSNQGNVNQLAAMYGPKKQGLDKEQFLARMHQDGGEYISGIDRDREFNALADLVIGATRRGMKILCVEHGDSTVRLPRHSGGFMREGKKYIKDQYEKNRVETKKNEFAYEFMDDIWPKIDPDENAAYQARYDKFIEGRTRLAPNKAILDRAIRAIRSDQALNGEEPNAALPKLMIRYGSGHELAMVMAASQMGYSVYAFSTFSSEADYNDKIQMRQVAKIQPDPKPLAEFIEKSDSLILSTHRLHRAAPVPSYWNNAIP